MLSLKPAQPSPSSSSPQKYTPNILPCRIALTSPVDVSKRYWCPETSTEGEKTAYFRGRKLVGRSVGVVDGYRGVVVRGSDRVVKINRRSTSSDIETSKGHGIKENGHDKFDERGLHEPEEAEESEDVDEEDPVKFLEEMGTFDEMIVWGHESLPGEDDAFVRGVGEWIRFAEGMHEFRREEELA